MAIINNIQKIRADLYDNSEIVVRAKQYDKASRYLNVTCTNNGETIRLSPNDYVAYSKIVTPTFRALHTKETINADGTITVALTDNVLNSAGKGSIDINLYSKNQESLITTMTITLIIQGSTYNDEIEYNTDEFSALSDLIAEVTYKEASYDKAESSRASAESTRVSNENTRKSNESSRQSAENTRNSNESTRKSNESARQSAESARASAETARKNAEASRVTAESARVTAETNRTSGYNTMITNANAKIAEAGNVNIKSTSGTNSYTVTITDRSGKDTTSPNLLNTISIGTVSTLGQSANATASLTGNFGSQKLNLGIPVGKTPHLTVGTVTTSDSAGATITGTDNNPVLNLNLPKGAALTSSDYLTTTEFEALFVTTQQANTADAQPVITDDDTNNILDESETESSNDTVLE